MGFLAPEFSTMDSNLCCVHFANESNGANPDQKISSASDSEFRHPESTRAQNQSCLYIMCVVDSNCPLHTWIFDNDVGRVFARISCDPRLAIRLDCENNSLRSLSVLASCDVNSVLRLSQHTGSGYNEETTGLFGRKPRDFGEP